MRSFQTQRGGGAPLDRASDPRIALAPPASDYVDERVLAANTAERHAVPSGAKFVLFSSTSDFRAKFGDSTVVAAGASSDVVDGTASELNPSARAIPDGVTHISLIASAACNVTLAFYKG